MIDRSKSTISIATLGLLAAGALIVLSGIGQAASTDTTTGKSGVKTDASREGIEMVPGTVLNSSEVCFVNDRHMGKPQIPVNVEGKIYYGCCAGCAETLRTKRSTRFSHDPLTGSEVDKATATIAPDPRGSGKVLYFESKQTYERYLASIHQ